MNHNELSYKIIGAAIKIHRALGPGLLEKAYQECLYYELCEMHLHVQKEKTMPLIYNHVHLDLGYRLDLLVNDIVVVEIKSVQEIHPVHKAQLLTYLKLGDFQLGLLLNFNVEVMRHGIHRFINGSISDD